MTKKWGMSEKMSSHCDVRQQKPKWTLRGFPPVMFLLFASCLISFEHYKSVAADGDFEEGYCAPYQGTTCRSFIRSSQVWFRRGDLDLGWENEKITAGLWEEMMHSLPKLCRNAAEVICFNCFDSLTISLIHFFTLETPLCVRLSPMCDYRRNHNQTAVML